MSVHPQTDPRSLHPIHRFCRSFGWTERLTMTTINAPHETNPYAAGFAAVVPLPAGWLPCSVCGVATHPDDQHGQKRVLSLGREIGPTDPPSLAQREFETPMTRCPSCADRRDEAVRLVEEFPRGRGRYPQPSLAAQVVDRALAVLAALEHTAVVKNDRSLRQLIEIVGPLGVGITWQGRFAPVAERNADPKTGAAVGWAWLTGEQRHAAREAAAEWLRARVQRPRPLAPPHGAGCYLCGVATVEALPSRAADVWSEARLRPEALGGSRGARVHASVCHGCAAEAEAVGSYGPTLIDRLVLRAAGIDRRLGAEMLQTDAQAWGTTGRATPNETPWAHVDLAALRADFESGRV